MDSASSHKADAAFDPLDALRILRNAGGALFNQALLHAELARIEWAEEKNRLLTMLVIAVLGVVCLICFLLFAGGVVVVGMWDTGYRLHAVFAVASWYGLWTVVAWTRVHAWSVRGREVFAASRAELAADAAILKGAA